MPYIHLNVSRPLTAEQIEAARQAIAAIMPTLPGKTRDNTMIHIDGACALSMGDEGAPCLFMEIRLHGASPEASKKEFVAKAAVALSELFDIPERRMYINIIELDKWGVGSRIV